MKKFDCLDERSPIFGHYLLEASAGTGKTFALEQIALRLILEKKASFMLEEILMVTFTKAATAEIKRRIRSHIEDMLSALTTIHGNLHSFPPYLSSVLQTSDPREIIHSLEEALFFFDRAQIFTIHGFCLQMLQEFAFEAKISFSCRVQESWEEKAMAKNCLKDLLFLEEEKGHFYPYQMLLLYQKTGEETKLLERLSRRRYRKNRNIQDLLKHIEEHLLQTPPQTEKIEKAFERIFSYFKLSSFSKEDLFMEIKILSSCLEKKTISSEELEGLFKTKLTLSSFLSTRNKKMKAPPFEEIVPEGSIFHWITRSLTPLFKEEGSPLSLLSLMQQRMEEKSEKEWEKKNLLTFDLIIKKMKKALDQKEFVEKVQKKYRAVLIDEFQDTDPIQWEIFRKLFLEKYRPSSLFLIGDPKQSIYRFRNADLYTYYQAAEFLGRDAHLYLDTNYRSSPSLVKALNGLLLLTSTSWLILPGLKKSLPYLPVKAGVVKETSFTDTKAPLHFFIVDGEQKESSSAEKLFFSYIASEIHHLYREEKIAYSEMAILVKDRFQLERIRGYLLGKNLPVSSRQRSSFSQSEALFSFEEFLQALFFPRETSKLKRALLGSYMGWSFEDLALDYEQELPRILERLFFLKTLLEEEGFAIFFQQFLLSSWKKDQQTTLQELVMKKDLTLYIDTMKLLDLFSENEKKHGNSFFSLISFIEELAVEEISQEPRIVSACEGVELMTLHAAKGLEFSIVFNLGVCSSSFFFEEKEDLLEENAEKMRQLYVALTRAKRRNYLPLHLSEEGKKIEREKISIIDLFCAHLLTKETFPQTISLSHFLKKIDSLQKEGLVSYEKITEIPSLVFSLNEEKKLVFHKKEGGQKKSGWLFSFSSLTKKEAEKNEQEFSYPSFPFSLQKLPMGKEVGILFHRIFEQFFSPKRYKKMEELIQEELEGTSFSPYEKTIQELALLALSTPLISEENNFCLAEVPRENCWTEVEFLFSLPPSQDLMKGSIDLFFLFKNKYYFIDWKTNWLGDDRKFYTPSLMQKAMEEHDYFLQASIYREALERFIPMMEKCDFTLTFGGAYYIFLRGLSCEKEDRTGIFHFIPEKMRQDFSLCGPSLLV